MADEPIDVWSGSSLNTFLRCAKQWEYAYVYRYKRPPKLRMILGTAAHAAAETDLRQKILSGEDLPVELLLDSYSTTFDAEAVEAEEPAKEKGDWKDQGVRSVRFWHRNVAPTVDPEYVEEPISFIINGIPWTGTLDDADKDRKIRDWKFTGRTPSSAEAYIVNMVGYAIGYRQKTGELESRIELDNVVALKKEVKLVPIRSDGPVPDQSIVAFVDILESAQRSVNAGIFMPNGLKSGACSWCGYKDICPAFRDSPMWRKYEEDMEKDLGRSLTVIEGGQA